MKANSLSRVKDHRKTNPENKEKVKCHVVNLSIAQKFMGKDRNPKNVQQYGVCRLFFLKMSEARIHKIEGIHIQKNSLINTLSPRRLKKDLIPIGDTSTGVHGKK